MYVKEVEIRYRKTAISIEHVVLDNPRRVVDYMHGALDFRPDQEQLWVILVDARLRAMGRFLCCLGTATLCPCHPRELFRAAIIGSACSIIMVHSHPSGDPTPSEEDKEFTKRVDACGELLGIPLLDHIILGRVERDPNGRGYYSFEDVEVSKSKAK